MREARTSLLIIHISWQIFTRVSKNLSTLTRTVKALFYPSVHSSSADNAMESGKKKKQRKHAAQKVTKLKASWAPKRLGASKTFGAPGEIAPLSVGLYAHDSLGRFTSKGLLCINSRNSRSEIDSPCGANFFFGPTSNFDFKITSCAHAHHVNEL